MIAVQFWVVIQAVGIDRSILTFSYRTEGKPTTRYSFMNESFKYLISTSRTFITSSSAILKKKD